MQRILFRFKYPKLLLFILSVVVAWLIFRNGSFGGIHEFILTLGYFGIFLAGFFYVYGLTSVPATAILLVLSKDENFLLAVLAASLGALLADLLLFFFIRYEFKDEIEKLPTKKFFKSKDGSLLHKIERLIYLIIAAAIISSPLPTEIGIAMMASIKKMSTKKFAIIAYVLHTIALIVIIMASKTIFTSSA